MADFDLQGVVRLKDETGAAAQSAAKNVESIGKAADNADDQIKQFSKEAESSTAALRQGFDSSSAAANKFNLTVMRLAQANKQLAATTDPQKQAELKVKIDELARSANKYEQEMKEAADANEDFAATSQDTAGGMDKLTGALTGLITVGAALKLTQQIVELGELGAQANRTTTAFENISGGAELAAANMRAMQDATGGALSRVDAMEQANRLLQMGLVSNSQELGDFTEMATRLGTAMGRDVNQSIEEFALLMANQSIPRLDTFGISASRVRERMAALADANKDITKEQRFNIAVQEEGMLAMQRLGDAQADQALQIERNKAAWADLKTEVGRSFAEGVANAEGATGGFTRKLADHLKIANDMRGEYSLLRLNVATFFDALGAGNTIFDQQRANLEAIALGNAALSQSYNDVGVQVATATTNTQSYAEAQTAAALAATELTIANNAAAAALGEMSQAALANQQIQVLQQAMEAGKISAEEFAEAQLMLLSASGQLTLAEQEAQGKINNITQAFISGELSASQMAVAVRDAKNAIDSLQDKTVTITYKQRGKAIEGITGGGLSEAESASILGGRGLGGEPPNFAAGGTMPFNGMAMVGERGPELAMLPQGARVFDNSRSTQITQNLGGVTVNNGAGFQSYIEELQRRELSEIRY